MEPKNHKNPRCTIDEDLALLRRYQNGDQEALTELVDRHLGLIHYWVDKILPAVPWVDREDLMQQAQIGFIRAAKKFKRFDPSHNYLHAYADRWVRGAIYQSAEVRIVKRTLYDNYRNVIDKREELVRELERSPTLEELSVRTQLSKKQVDNALNVIAAFPLLLEERDEYQLVENRDESSFGLPSEEEDGRDATDNQVESPLQDAINQLSSYAAEVIIRYYYRAHTDRQIAQDLGKSTKAITMQRRRALQRLREILAYRNSTDGTKGS